MTCRLRVRKCTFAARRHSPGAHREEYVSNVVERLARDICVLDERRTVRISVLTEFVERREH